MNSHQKERGGGGGAERERERERGRQREIDRDRKRQTERQRRRQREQREKKEKKKKEKKRKKKRGKKATSLSTSVLQTETHLWRQLLCSPPEEIISRNHCGSFFVIVYRHVQSALASRRNVPEANYDRERLQLIWDRRGPLVGGADPSSFPKHWAAGPFSWA